MQVHFDDKSKTTVKVSPTMSMGEFIFYVSDKRSLNPTEVGLFTDSTAKKAVKMTGSIRDCGLKELHLLHVAHKKSKKDKFSFRGVLKGTIGSSHSDSKPTARELFDSVRTKDNTFKIRVFTPC
jgi:hypothetical protein